MCNIILPYLIFTEHNIGLDLYNQRALFLRWVNFNETPGSDLSLCLPLPPTIPPSICLCLSYHQHASSPEDIFYSRSSFPLFYIPPPVLQSEPCCTTAPQSGSWATCSRISSTSRFLPGGSTSFVIFCWRVRGNAISWINWPSGLLSTCRHTNKNKWREHWWTHQIKHDKGHNEI